MKIFKKAKEFYNKYNYEIKTILFGIAVIGAGYYVTKKIGDYIESPKADMSDIATPPALTYGENSKYEWSEEKYRETYDQVIEFAKTLQLRDGESYWIDRDDRYNDGEIIVSHLIDGIGVYPDEEPETEKQ